MAKNVVRDLTVAKIREGPGPVQVLFLESARFYALPRERADFDVLLALLRASERQGRAVKVTLATIDSETILGVGPI
jgi:hypothetical protein